MTRDYKHIDQHLNKLLGEVYPQPDDPGHTRMAQKVIDQWASRMTTCHSVLDVGCGTAFCQPMFENWGMSYEGICLGEDYLVGKELGRNVKRMDFNFLEYEDESFDLVFSRHSLEHSPMPILSLMEWRRVAKNWLGLILPAPEWYTYKGQNHYSVMNLDQINNLLDMSGWRLLWQEVHMETPDKEKPDERLPNEYWLMSEKKR